MLKSLYSHIPAFTVLVMLFYPFMVNLVYSNTELLDNRPLREKPTSLSRNYAQNFSDYYNDTFAGKEKLVSKYLKLKQKLKIDTGQYFYGEEDWMFYDSIKVKNGNTMADYYGEVRYTDNELHKIKQGIEDASDFYKNLGVSYMVLIAPNKEGIYSEYMPKRMQKIRASELSRMDVAVNYLAESTSVSVLNLKPVILGAKKALPHYLYYKHDTHWNDIGAYVGFTSLMEVMTKKGVGYRVPDATKMEIEPKQMIKQDMHPTDMEMAYHVKYLDDKSYNQEVLNEGKVIVYDNKFPMLKKTVLLAGDSFAEALLPYLAKTYARVINVSAGVKDNGFYAQLVKQYKPDIVIDELIERYFSRFLKYNDIYGRGLE